LKINDQIPFEKSLANEKIEPFAKIVAERKKYKKDEFTLDFDITDFNYSVCEVELMVEDETKIDQAVEKIEKFRKENGFSDKKIKGKLIEYIYRNSPKHYESLVASGIVSD
jgi:adenylate cyclase class IV